MLGEPLNFQGLRLKGRLGRFNRARVENVLRAYESLWHECERLQRRLAEAETELRRYRSLEQHLSDGLVAAERTGAEVRAHAQEQAGRELEVARANAKRIIQDVRGERDALKAEIEHLEGVESQLQASFRSWLLEALEVIDRGRARSELEAKASPESLDDV